jgi:glycosyltransferase involved in cell wall biosynthesis
MYLAVDAQALQVGDVRGRGIGRYTSHLIRALADASGWRIEAVVNAALAMPDPAALGRVAVRTFEPLLPIDPSTRDANERYFGDWLSALGADAVLEPNVFEGEGLVPRFARPRPLVAGVVYDLIPLIFQERYLADPLVRRQYGARLRQLAAMDLLLAISECTRSDVVRLMRWSPTRVATIRGGADRGTTSPTSGHSKETLTRLGIDRPFVLCVGGVDPRKNLAGALAAYAALSPATREDLLLVIVCALTAPQAADLDQQAASLGVRGNVRLTGFLDDEQLYCLYEACRLMLFPSYYEGLGLPVLEALQAGAPVVATNRSAVPEFAGSVSRLVDPSSVDEMTAAIQAELAEPRDRHLAERRQFAAGFRWSDTGRLTADAIVRAGRERTVRRSGRKPRVAWVSPFPPARSGISDYSTDLVDRLSADFEIEPVVSTDATTEGRLSTRLRVVRASEALERHVHVPYDLFVYHLGNSDLHVYELDLMQRQSGLIVLHDVQLGGLALRASAAGRWPGSLAAELEREGLVDLAAQLRRGEGDHDRIDASAGLYRGLIESSDGVVVHSAWSWRQVRPYADVPLFRISMGVPPVPYEERASVRARLGLPPDSFTVATLGEVTPAKQVDRIIRAVAELPDPIRARLLLVVAGPVPVALEAELVSLAQQVGLARQVRFEGRVGMDRLVDLGRVADACVQLRFPTRGETSAALLRALAAGSACIVSDAGSFSELPADVVMRVTPAPTAIEPLTAALVRLHDDQELRDRLRGRARSFAASSHSLDLAAAAYASAMHLTIARRTARDGDWIDGASAALAAVDEKVRPVDTAIAQWAQLRSANRKRS